MFQREGRRHGESAWDCVLGLVKLNKLITYPDASRACADGNTAHAADSCIGSLRSRNHWLTDKEVSTACSSGNTADRAKACMDGVRKRFAFMTLEELALVCAGGSEPKRAGGCIHAMQFGKWAVLSYAEKARVCSRNAGSGEAMRCLDQTATQLAMLTWEERTRACQRHVERSASAQTADAGGDDSAGA